MSTAERVVKRREHKPSPLEVAEAIKVILRYLEDEVVLVTNPSDNNSRFDYLPDVMSADDVAGVLQCARKTVYDMCRRGIIPNVKVGSLIRIPKHEFIAWFEGQLRPGV